MKRASLALIAILSIAASPRGEITTGEAEVSAATQKERHDRNIDRAALASQQKAIATLERLLKKNRGEENEPVFLRKLAELHQQSAAIEFRIAHGLADARRSAPDLKAYNGALRQSVSSLDELVREFPRADEIHSAYYLRGKAYEDLKDKASAKRDYLKVVREFPGVAEAVPAHMSLAEFSIEAGDHPTAISHLKEVVKDPMGLHYPFALYKMAWSYHNLRDVPHSLLYLEKQIAHYRRVDQERLSAYGRGLDSSEVAILENSLTDLTSFYLEGYEQNKDAYPPSEAFGYFRKIESGPVLGRMLSRYAKLLRAHKHEEGLAEWKQLVVRDEPSRPEAVDVVMIAFENLMNQRKYQDLPALARDFVTLHLANADALASRDPKDTSAKPMIEAFGRAQKQLTEAAALVQKLVVKNKGIKDAAYLSDTLARLYETFIRIVPADDPRVYGAHYNLAETLFEISRFEDSVPHYRWILENEKGVDAKLLEKSQISVRTASLRAVGARYEALRAEKLLPEKLEAMAATDGSPRSLEKRVAEWIDWVDAHVSRFGFHEEAVEHFHFDANRALYASRDFGRSIERLTKFAQGRPGSKFAVPSASLVLDTRIKGEDWENVYEFTTGFLARKGWNDGAFGKRLGTLAADSHYKLTERAFASGDFGEAVSRSRECVSKFKDSPRRPDCLLVAAKGEINQGDADDALPFLGELIERFPKTANASEAALLRASHRESRDEFGAAAEDYLAYLSWENREGSDAEKLRERVLTLAWLSQSPELLSRVTSSKSICKGRISVECGLYALLARIDSDAKALTKSEAEKAVERSYKDDDKRLRPLWAVLALKRVGDLGFRDRMLAARVIGASFKSLDPVIRLSLLPELRRSLPDAFSMSRAAVRTFARLQPTEQSIKRRVELIKEMEGTAEKIVKLGFPDLQVATLHTLSAVYQDLANELLAMAPPKGLAEAEAEAFKKTLQDAAFPFEEKGSEIASKAFEIAGKRGVDAAIFDGFAKTFFETNPSQAKDLEQPFRIASREGGFDGLLERLVPGTDWDDAKDLARSGDELKRRKGLWYLAARSGRWRQAAYFLDRIRETRDAPKDHEAETNAMQAYTLSGMGFTADAVSIVEENWDELPLDRRAAALGYMLEKAVNNYSRERSRELLSRWSGIAVGGLARSAADDEEALTMALAAVWGGFEMEPTALRELLVRARSADSREGARWARQKLSELGEPAKLAAH